MSLVNLETGSRGGHVIGHLTTVAISKLLTDNQRSQFNFFTTWNLNFWLTVSLNKLKINTILFRLFWVKSTKNKINGSNQRWSFRIEPSRKNNNGLLTNNFDIIIRKKLPVNQNFEYIKLQLRLIERNWGTVSEWQPF